MCVYVCVISISLDARAGLIYWRHYDIGYFQVSLAEPISAGREIQM